MPNIYSIHASLPFIETLLAQDFVAKAEVIFVHNKAMQRHLRDSIERKVDIIILTGNNEVTGLITVRELLLQYSSEMADIASINDIELIQGLYLLFSELAYNNITAEKLKGLDLNNRIRACICSNDVLAKLYKSYLSNSQTHRYKNLFNKYKDSKSLLFIYSPDMSNNYHIMELMKLKQSNIIISSCGNECHEPIEEYHPQFAYKNLLGLLSVDSSEVSSLGIYSDYRNKLVDLLFCTEEAMSKGLECLEDADNITIFEGNSIFNEASMILNILKNCDGEVTIIADDEPIREAIITELELNNIQYNNYINHSIIRNKTVVILLQIMQVALSPESDLELLSLMKMFNKVEEYTADEYQVLIGEFEGKIVRGIKQNIDVKYKLEKFTKHISSLIDKINEAFINNKKASINTREDPINERGAFINEQEDFHKIFKVHMSVLIALVKMNALDDCSNDEVLDKIKKVSDASVNKEQCYEFLHSIMYPMEPYKEELDKIKKINNISVNKEQYDGFIRSIMKAIKLDIDVSCDTRVRIISKAHVPFLCSNTVIVTNFNEGEWPKAESSTYVCDAQMRERLGLKSYHASIGADALRLGCILCKDRVYLMRSEQGVLTDETMQSRWLLYLRAILNKINEINSAELKVGLPGFNAPMPRPSITLESSMMPDKYSATMVEELIRDPYIFYLKYILKLRSEKEISPTPGPMEFGIFLHKVLESYIKGGAHGLEELMIIGKEEIRKYPTYKNVRTFWEDRFHAIAEVFIDVDDERRKDTTSIKVEQEYSYTVHGIKISAKCDRVETKKDNTIAIIDYKTGSLPPKSDILLGISPQLIIQALAVEEATGLKVSEIIYWQFKDAAMSSTDEDTGKDGVTVDYVYKKKCIEFKEMKFIRDKESKYDLEKILSEAEAGLASLIYDFHFGEAKCVAIPCIKKPSKSADYTDLIREKEWRI